MAEKRALTLTILAAADLVHGGAHVVVYASPRHATENPEGVVMRVEQHLMGLQQIGADSAQERPAVAKLGVRHLQLDTNATDDREVLAPVELESLTWCKLQRHEASPPGSLLQPMTFLLPGPGKRHATLIVGSVVAEADAPPHSCLTVRRCLRGRPASRRSHPDSFSA